MTTGRVLTGDPRLRIRDSTTTTVDDLRSLVTLSREDPADIGERQVFVRLDEGVRVAVVYGQNVTIEVEPGSHRLFVHNTLFWKRLAFAIEPGEHLELALVNRGRWWTYGVAGVLGAAPLFLSAELRSRV